MNIHSKILMASSDSESRHSPAAILNKGGWNTITVYRVSECQEVLATQDVGLVFCERHLVDGDYRDLLAVARSLGREVRIVVTKRLDDWDEHLEVFDISEDGSEFESRAKLG